MSIAGRISRVCILYGTAAAEEFLAEDMSGLSFCRSYVREAVLVEQDGGCGSVPVSVRKREIASLYRTLMNGRNTEFYG